MTTIQKSLALAVLAATTAATVPAAAQIQDLPRRSPHAVTKQKIGLTKVAIDYHRPSVQEREIWGGLVPYDAVWRAGANDNTTIAFSHPVKIEGQDLAAGKYGLHMIPTSGDWTVIFSNNSTSWGSFTYDEAEDALRVTVTPEEAPFTEWLAYGFDDLSDGAATASLRWENVRVPFKIETDTHALVMDRMKNGDLRHLPRFSWQGWRDAANYSLQNDVDFEQGLEWIERSISMEENANNLIVKAGLLDKLERGDEAKEIRMAALEMANEGQRNNIGYQLLFGGDVDGAIEIFQANVDRHPDSWNTYDSLAEAYATKGDKASAMKLYEKALEMAPEDQHARINGVLDGLRK